MLVFVLLFPACQETGDHGITCTDRIDKPAFGSGKSVDMAVLVQKDRAHAGHGYQNIDGAHFLELFRVGYNGFSCLEFHSEDLTDLVMVGLDQEGVILQDIEQKILCRINDKTDSAALKRLENIGIDCSGHALGNAACEYKRVSFFESLELCHQSVLSGLIDHGPHAVDLSAVDIFQLEIDPGEAVPDADEVIFQTHLIHSADQLVTGEAGDKSKSSAVNAKVSEDSGHINALSAGQHLLVDCPVRLSKLEIRNGNNVVQRRIECYCVDHSLTSFP